MPTAAAALDRRARPDPLPCKPHVAILVLALDHPNIRILLHESLDRLPYLFALGDSVDMLQEGVSHACVDEKRVIIVGPSCVGSLFLLGEGTDRGVDEAGYLGSDFALRPILSAAVQESEE